jgi:cytochrome c oxidase accessory protein FixG
MFEAIYHQSVSGKHRNIKYCSLLTLICIYLGSSWIRWDRGHLLPDQAVFIDLPHRKAYLFFIEIWPDQVYYIAGILILAALGLFFITSLYGRIWCGYTCPHTVYVDIFTYIEKFFQGDRNERIKLDDSPMSSDKFKKKLFTHIAWMSVGFTFAFGWVCYFYDAPSLFHDILHFHVNTSATAWLLGLTFSTYFFAGWVRERVCTYFCPYGRFQSGMLDNDSSVVTYHDWRGEPRGKYSLDNINSGDCIDCNKCVVVCPMGIDIRDGLQLSCIGCGLCIDACNSVMEKIARPLGLIAYDSINSTLAKKNGSTIRKKVFGIKILLFGSIFLAVSSILTYTLTIHKPYTVSVEHDRLNLLTVLPDGDIRNKYVVKIFNRKPVDINLEIKAIGLENAQIKILGSAEKITDSYQESYRLIMKPEEEKDLSLFIKVTSWNSELKSKSFFISITEEGGDYKSKSETVFIGKN